MATVSITVLDPFIPRDEPAGEPDTPPASLPSEPLTADGPVLEAVHDLLPLPSVTGEIGAHGIVVSAVNQAGSLRGISASDYVGELDARAAVAIDAERIWQIEKAAGIGVDGAGRASAIWTPEGLTGFSLRMGLLGRDLGGSERSEIIIETLVRERTLVVQISDALSDPARKVLEYRVMQANGEPLPAWLNRLRGGMFVGERPADVEMLKLRVTVIYSDGSTETKYFEIETVSGELKPLKAGRGAGLAVPFHEQFAVTEPSAADAIEELVELLKAS
jgi:hypothetical protein